MDVKDFLKSLAIDAWYKAVMYLGGVLLTISFSLEVKGLTNHQLQLLAGGAFFFGLGEWKNHKVATWIKPPSAYTGGPALMSATVRKADFLGLVLDIVGFTLIVLGIVSIIRG